MSNLNTKSMFALGVFILLGLGSLGFFLSNAILKYKQLDRSVLVKGLSTKQFDADVVLWPIKFVLPDTNLTNLNKKLDVYTKDVLAFLKENGIKKEEINILSPSIKDRLANDYVNRNFEFRYLGSKTINVYSKNVKKVRAAITKLQELSKKGIIFKVNDYDTKVEYMFTRLNEIKPLMIEESTKNARAVALKFAKDSSSKLGKIKKAKQGQFSIYNRDKNTPHIKTVRVVSTIEYYLDD